MLDWFQVVVLSIVQGITEFLPVSSSAHLILVPSILGWKDQGLAFDITVHLGTLLAVISYFRTEIIVMCRDFMRSLKGYGMSVHARLLWSIGFATIPVGLVGLFSRKFVESTLRSPLVIAFTTIGFGLILWLADKKGKQRRELQTLNWRDVVAIGFAQALSLIPGVSRSGITLTAGLFCNLTRESAARFSFLLSIPVIILAGGLESVKLFKSSTEVDWASLGLGLCLSAISGYFCIHYFLKLMNRIGLFPFILYRLCLGVFLLFYFYPKA
jgi:undecaprenyl-diphosphatase